MPLKRMPNGEYVNVPDGISPQALAKIEGQFKATRVEKRAAATASGTATKRKSTAPETSVAQEAAAYREKRKKADASRTGISGFVRDAGDVVNKVNPLNWFGGLGSAGVLANFDDELSGVGGGIRSAVQGQGFSRGYSVAREARNQEKSEARAANPVLGTAAEVGGSLLNPLVTGSSALLGAGKVAAKVAPAASRALTRAGTAIQGSGAITKGVLTGANQGALNAAGSSENLENTPKDAAVGAGVGAAFGGALGIAGRGIQGGYRILKDRGEDAAQRVAFGKVSEALGTSKITPEAASAQLQTANREGGDAMLMDLSPNLTSMALNLSRNSKLPNANKLIERGERRALSRGGRVAGKVASTAKLPEGIRDFDALREGADLANARKGLAAFDTSKGGPLDKPIEWADDLKQAVTSAPNYERLMKSAFELAEQHGDDLGRITDGQVIPSMRAWNYLKKEYDRVIKPMYRAGDTDGAAGYSSELGRIKAAVAKQNPEYEKYLASQTDYYQQEAALELGEQLWKDLSKAPRQANKSLDDLKHKDTKEFDQARVGMIDKLMNDLLTSPNPITVINKVTNENNPAQRKALIKVFGGKKQYDDFMRYFRTEVAGNRSDGVTRYGGQSITSRASQASGVGNDLAELGIEGAAGGMFGGPGGVVANIGRGLSRRAKITSDSAQDEIAGMLMSKGGDEFIDGIKRAIEYKKAQLANNEILTTSAAKGGQQYLTTPIGGE